MPYSPTRKKFRLLPGGMDPVIVHAEVGPVMVREPTWPAASPTMPLELLSCPPAEAVTVPSPTFKRTGRASRQR